MFPTKGRGCGHLELAPGIGVGAAEQTVTRPEWTQQGQR